MAGRAVPIVSGGVCVFVRRVLDIGRGEFGGRFEESADEAEVAGHGESPGREVATVATRG